MDLKGGTPRDSMLVAEINGERYHILTQESSKGIPGARTWEVDRVPSQAADPTQEFQLPALSFHDGAGFSYAGLPNVYERADGWDASAPGKVTTWARHATGESFDSVNYRGWCIFYASRLYVMRGRYCYWYAIDPDHGDEWKQTLSKDFGEGKVVCGEPAIFKGKLYVPIANASTGADEDFWELTTVGEPDTWTQGDLPARCFKTWHNQKTGFPVLVAATENYIKTVSENPMTEADWGADTYIGDSSTIITQLAVWRDSLLILKENGLFSLDQVEVATNELPDLVESVDYFNGVGTAYSNGFLLIPHKSGLIRWQPNVYRFVGPNQEGALEDITPGWGRVQHVTPFGKYAYISVADTVNETGVIYGLEPPRGNRGPLVPHAFHTVTDGYFEGMCLVQDVNDVKTYLVALKVNKAGTTVEPWIYQLPRNDQPPGSDPTIVKARSGASFHTARYMQPGREIQKSWRTVEFWMEANPATSTPGLQVWASVDNRAAIQLLDGNGDPATFYTSGFKQAFFPKTSAAVGAFVQLEFRVPDKGDGEVDVAVTFRDVVMRGDLDPIMTDVIRTTIVCGPGEYEDLTSSRRTPRKQLDDLIALANPQSDAIPFKDPWGRTGYAKVGVMNYREVVFKNKSLSQWVANVELRVRKYDAS